VCKTVNGVLKELIVFALIYNLVRLVMGQAARRQQVSIERISFIDALRWRQRKATSCYRRWSSIPTVPIVMNRVCGNDVRSPIR
jgi:hypothetical protein